MLNENVLVEVLEEEKDDSGILVPDTHKGSKFGAGKVLSVQDDFSIKVGDTVFFDLLLLTTVKFKDKEFKFIKFSDILGYEGGDGSSA